MGRLAIKPDPSLVETILGKASWLLSHAEALADEGRDVEASAELSRAAQYEELSACLLDAVGCEQEAVIHRVSAASCYEQLHQHARAVTSLRAALSVALTDKYRQKIEDQLNRCLAQAYNALQQQPSGLVYE